MNLKHLTNLMLKDLYLINTGGKEDYEFAGFATGKNNYQVTLDRVFEDRLSIISLEIFNNYKPDFRIDEIQFKKIVRKAIVNLITTDQIDLSSDFDNLELIRCETQNLVKETQIEHVHIIPARTLGFEKKGRLKIGPTTIFSLEEWIENSEFHNVLKEKYGGNEIYSEWKINLLLKLKNPAYQITGVADKIYEFVKDSNSIIKVNLKGFEYDFSKKLSKLIAKTTLDMLSLFLGWQNAFYKQIIHDERIGPAITYDLKEFDGYIGFPGVKLEKQTHPLILEGEREIEFLSEFEKFKENFEYILDSFINLKNCKYPLLTHRWILALRWYAEGIREPDDVIAVAKLACCLDALSNGGKLGGIKTLLTNILGIESDQIIFKDKIKNIDLHTFVKRVYDNGRSRVFHGTIEDMLESYEIDKLRLIECCRLVLLETLVRLKRYDGQDIGKAFQLMK